MRRVLGRLDSTHQKLLETIGRIEPDVFRQRPSSDEWSVAEIVQHLCLVEERVSKELERAIASPPRRPAFLKRLIPTSIVSLRLIRVKAPKAMNPIVESGKEECVENYNRARAALKDLCAQHDRNRFKNIVFKHPFLGEIDGVATVSFVGYHEQRHLKQIKEVLWNLAADSRG